MTRPRKIEDVIRTHPAIDVPLYLQLEWIAPEFDLQLRRESPTVSEKDIAYTPCAEHDDRPPLHYTQRNCPTQDEIETAKAEIQATWDSATEKRRRGQREEPTIEVKVTTSGVRERAIWDMMQHSHSGEAADNWFVEMKRRQAVK